MKKLIAFFEIPASDFHRAVDFYETVLGMQLPTFECETEKMACFTEEGETVGAISYASNFDFLPSTHGVLYQRYLFMMNKDGLPLVALIITSPPKMAKRRIR